MYFLFAQTELCQSYVRALLKFYFLAVIEAFQIKVVQHKSMKYSEKYI